MPWSDDFPLPVDRVEGDYKYSGNIFFPNYNFPSEDEIYFSSWVGKIEFVHNHDMDGEPEGYFNILLEAMVEHMRAVGYKMNMSRTLLLQSTHEPPPGVATDLTAGGPEANVDPVKTDPPGWDRAPGK